MTACRIGFRDLPRWTPEDLIAENTQPGTVSVVIPAFNAAGMILDALNSCYRQTHHIDEVVVVDDGSTDCTWELLNNLVLVPCRVRCKRQSQNLGVSATRNHGARLATGEFIFYLNADDIAPPERVEQSLAEFAAGADAVYGQKEYFSVEDGWAQRIARNAVKPPTPQNVLGAGFNPSTLAVRRSVHLDRGLWWDDRMSVAEDAEFLIALLEADLSVCCSPNVYAWIGESAQQLTHRGDWQAMRRYMAEKHRDWLTTFYGK
jgi:glycosyltransferase involved in cell wall biosynthesis